MNWGKGEWAKINQTVEPSVWLSLFRATWVPPSALGGFFRNDDLKGLFQPSYFCDSVTWKLSDRTKWYLRELKNDPYNLCGHITLGCLIVIIYTKNTLSTWQIKYCKNCVFQLSECSCKIFFMYVLACSKCCPWTSVCGIIGYFSLEEASWGHLAARSVEVRAGFSELYQIWSWKLQIW